MLEDYYEESLRKKYQQLSKYLISNNLKKFFVEKEYREELICLNNFHKSLVKNRLNNLLKEKNIKKDHYLCDDMNFLNKIKTNLNFNFQKNKIVLKNIISQSFSKSNNPEEIINSIIFWDKILENLNYYSNSNYQNKLFSKENFDEKFFNQKFKSKYFLFEVLDIDDLILEDLQNNNLNNSYVSKIDENENKISNNINSEKIIDLNLLRKNFEGKNQKRRKIMRINHFCTYLPLECNGFCNRLINFVKKSFFSHIFNNKNFNNNEIINKNEKFKNFTMQDFKEFEILIYKNCLFSHNQNEINYHFLKYKTNFCKLNNCNFFSCEKVHLDKCLDDELVILYKKSNNDFNLLEKYLKDKINKKFEKLQKENEKKEEINLNNLNISDINSNLDPNDSDKDSSKNDDDEEYNKLSFTKNPKKIILDYDHIIENIKTQECPLKSLCIDKKECFKFHNLLEKRRNPKSFLISNNLVCKFAFQDKKWVDPSNCPNGDFCEFFHTRNELFYDRRNFRKLYDCYTEQEKGKCPYFSVCPYKHNIDININEIFLPNYQLEVIEKNFFENLFLIEKLKKLKNELNVDNKSSENEIKLSNKCIKCKHFILDKLVILLCMHNYCLNCLNDIKISKNCIFNCIKNRYINNEISFREDYEYFIKSLEENLGLRVNLFSKKANVIKNIKNARIQKNTLKENNNDNSKQKHFDNDKILENKSNNSNENFNCMNKDKIEIKDLEEEIEESYEMV